jgi:uncharacterized membrane protein
MLIVLVLAVVSIALFGYFALRLAGYPGYYYPFPFFLPFAGFFGLFWILIIFCGISWLFWPRRWGYSRTYWGCGDEHYTLEQRYARGEITKEQFDQITRDLKEHAEASGPS